MSNEKPSSTEQQPKEYVQAEAQLQSLFNEKDEDKLEQAFANLRFYASYFHIEPEPLIARLRSNLKMRTADEFVRSSFPFLKEFLDARISHPELFEEIRHEYRLQRGEYIKLSDLMYCDVDLKSGTATMHIGERGNKSIGELLKSLREGMKELVEQVRKDARIKEIQATSWIVASNPGLLKKVGFTVHGIIDEKIREENFKDEERPVAWASITREELLKKYPK